MTHRPRSPFPSRHRPSGTQADPAARWPSGGDARRIADALGRSGMHCVLCAAPSAWRGIWYPTMAVSERLGAARGKQRLVAFGLCAGCRELPDAIDRAERRILDDARAGLERPEAN